MSPIFVRARFVRTAIATAAFLPLVSLAGVTACGGSTEPKTPPPPPADVTPASITSNVTTPLTGVAGAQLNTALQVTVLNKEGQPIDTATVTFAVASGGGSVSNTSVKTDANGVAATTWTLGPTAGTQTVTATAGSLAPVTFTATATAGAAKTIAKNSTDPQTAVAGATVAVPPSVKVTDQNGNPVSGVFVTFLVASGGGSVTGGAANTDANGVATVGSWRLGAIAGVNTLTATANGISTTITFSATGTAGTVTQVKITNTAPTLTVGQTFTLTTQTLDANNNVVLNAPVTWSSSNTSVATVSSTGLVVAVSAGATTITATSGSATAQQTINVIGHPSTATVADTVTMSSTIGGIAVSNTTAYVARSSAAAVGIVDIASHTLTTSVALGANVLDVAASASGSVVAAITGSPNQVVLINTANVAHDTIALSATPVKLAATASGSKVFVDLNSFQVDVINPVTHTVTDSLTLAGTVTAMRVAPGDSLLYIATKFGSIYEVSTLRNSIKRTLQGPANAADLAFTADGKTMLVADGSPNVTVMQLATGGIANEVISDFGANAVNAIAVSPDGKQLWVAQVNATYVIDITNNNQLGVVPPPIAGLASANPGRIVFTPLGNHVIIVDNGLLALIITR